MRSVFFRYFFRSSLLLILSLLVLGLALVAGASDVLAEQQREQMQKTAQEVSKYIEVYLTPGSQFVFRFDRNTTIAVTTIGNITSLHVCFFNTTGQILLTSDAPGTGLVGLYMPQEVVSLALENRSIPNELLRDTLGTVEAVETYTINTAFGQAGVVLISSNRAVYRTLMSSFMRTWLMTSLIVLLLSCALAYFSARRLARPLRGMAACAQSFAHGDFSARVPGGDIRDGETAKLSSAFNAMADALQNAEELHRGFIANVSHELKTPMTTIAGFIGGILDGTVPPERRDDTLRLVREEVMRLSRMVSGMTSLTRLQNGQMDIHPRPFDIGELSLRVLLSLEGKINDKGLEVELDLAEAEGLFVMADPDSVVQVLTNLLDNAIKFSDRGGVLKLSVHQRSGQAHISVANRGPTIPPEDLPFVFDRFYKADRSRSADRTGLGLGLFLVKTILNAHDQDILVRSGGGETVFTFTLPETKTRG